ncbi:MAG: hypothetical protein EHM42_10785 [Planctomycetaceae bacterium]|nr:MAG: hypothetical protein EHM42_10785 [Planctomycetaceae bacterium]
MVSVAESVPGVKGSRLSALQIAVVAVVGDSAAGVIRPLEADLSEILRELLRIVIAFVADTPSPQKMWELERSLDELLRRMGRIAVEFAVNRLEPEQSCQMPARLRRDTQEFSRKGTKTRQRGGIACLFGMVELWRWSYEPLSEEREAGARSIASLVEQLGIVADNATPALAEVIGRLSQEHSESGVRKFLEREHAVNLCSQSICKIRDAVAGGISAHLREQQVRSLLETIRQGRTLGRIILAVGRDGIFVPQRGVKKDRWKEAAVGTVSVYVRPRRGKIRRLCTVYLGQMPKPGQEELSDGLTDLLRQVLADDAARGILLVYITDAGHHPREYFDQVLTAMEDPHHPSQRLQWRWIVDFFHGCGRLGQLADALFHDAATASAWVKRMRHMLKHEPNAIHKILHSAAALRPASLRGKAKETYETAYQYLLNHRHEMDYVTYRRQRLPIGSGVTEAACKTVFTQRFKCSGMIWGRNSDYDHRDPQAQISGARSVLVLRLTVLSQVWPAVFQAYLATKTETAKSLTNPQLRCQPSRKTA